ncbi:hypothetical protein LZ30DRAFT_722066, partial [Colletotrichum cereale]
MGDQCGRLILTLLFLVRFPSRLTSIHPDYQPYPHVVHDSVRRERGYIVRCPLDIALLLLQQSQSAGGQVLSDQPSIILSSTLLTCGL